MIKSVIIIIDSVSTDNIPPESSIDQFILLSNHYISKTASSWKFGSWGDHSFAQTADINQN